MVSAPYNKVGFFCNDAFYDVSLAKSKQYYEGNLFHSSN